MTHESNPAPGAAAVADLEIGQSGGRGVPIPLAPPATLPRAGNPWLIEQAAFCDLVEHRLGCKDCRAGRECWTAIWLRGCWVLAQAVAKLAGEAVA